MKQSDKCATNAKWFMTWGLAMTILANVVTNEKIALIVLICALFEYVMVGVEMWCAQRHKVIEAHEEKEIRKRIKTLINEINETNKMFEEEMRKKKKSGKGRDNKKEQD